MLFRKLLPFAVVLFALPLSARAQIGAYGMVTGENLHSIPCNLSAVNEFSACNTPTGTEKPYGASFGGFYDFHTFGPFRVGVDLRGAVLNTDKNFNSNSSSSDFFRQYSALAGPRVEFGTYFKLLRPYAEVLAGWSKFGPVYSYQNYTQAEGLVGVDIPLLPVLDLRAIELGAGGTFGPSSHSTESIGAGLVFHTPR